jgi:hypothetical protein
MLLLANASAGMSLLPSEAFLFEGGILESYFFPVLFRISGVRSGSLFIYSYIK